ncbi:MAG: hypothetical protein JW861_08370 [Bacteroidales bacterium]|nr:hypothetical protein [Bacteroidales bacterium]
MARCLKACVPAVCFLITLHGFTLHGQEASEQLRWDRISRPVKWWAILHPFVAPAAYYITLETLRITDSIRMEGTLDGEKYGGCLDAFRHASWMALMSREMRWQKAWRLGVAHEKGNRIAWQRAIRKGLNPAHDHADTEMDLFNNCRGLRIGRLHSSFGRKTIYQAVIDSVIHGKMMMISRNSRGAYLDVLGNVIPPDSLKGRWFTARCLVPTRCTEDNLRE